MALSKRYESNDIKFMTEPLSPFTDTDLDIFSTCEDNRRTSEWLKPKIVRFNLNQRSKSAGVNSALILSLFVIRTGNRIM